MFFFICNVFAMTCSIAETSSRQRNWQKLICYWQPALPFWWSRNSILT